MQSLFWLPLFAKTLFVVSDRQDFTRSDQASPITMVSKFDLDDPDSWERSSPDISRKSLEKPLNIVFRVAKTGLAGKVYKPF